MAAMAERGWKLSRWLLIAAAAIALVAIAYAVTRRDAATSAAPEAAPANSATADASTDPQAMIRALQEQVGANPRDATGWQRLGQAYFMLQRYADASRAYRRAAGLQPNDAAIWSAYGEATAMASERDPMPDEAAIAFQKAHELDPKDARARYFLAVARDLKGEHEGAIDDWLDLLKDSPADASYVPDLRRTIEQVARINKIDVADRLAAIRPAPPSVPAAGPSSSTAPIGGDPVATGAIPGPTPDQMAAARSLPPSAQNAMVEGMIASLEAKLRANPAYVDGWIMLMRSRATLGDTAKALAARDAAIRANPGATARIRNAATTLGLPTS